MGDARKRLGSGLTEARRSIRRAIITTPLNICTKSTDDVAEGLRRNVTAPVHSRRSRSKSGSNGRGKRFRTRARIKLMGHPQRRCRIVARDKRGCVGRDEDDRAACASDTPAAIRDCCRECSCSHRVVKAGHHAVSTGPGATAFTRNSS